MSKKSLLLGAIASIIAINSVFADTKSTVTSQGYVDAADALKQNKIDATGADFTNGSVVETTSTPGVVTQRGIFKPETGLAYGPDGYYIRSGTENELITAADLPSPRREHVLDLECADENCTLWNISDREVFIFNYCNSDNDCSCSGMAFCDTETHRCGCSPFM